MTERKLTQGGAIALMMVAVAAVLAIWASPALAAGAPGAVPGLVSTTHADPATWYSSADPAFTWGAAQQQGGGSIAGYSFVLDQSPTTVPPATSGTVLSFLPKVTYAVGAGPSEDRVADLNGDGKPDIVAENASANTVSVLLGNGDGTFRAAVSYATGTNPWSLAIGDVNGDGKLDIVSCNESASTVSVLLGNGDGTFRANVDYTTGASTSPECMRLGDLNGDGKLDIVTANAGTSNVSVLYNQGGGTFAAPLTFSTASHPTSIAIGDLNGDGKQDLVTANYDTNNVSVLLGNGNGTFQATVNYACGTQPETVVLADLNGDGRLDVATANYTNSVSVLLNRGDGTLLTHVDYATGAGPYSLDAADMNHDGTIDLVTVNHAANTVSVLFGAGDGTFGAKNDLSTGNGPFWVALGDFNRDGFGDVAVTNETDGTLSVLLGSAYFRPSTSKLAASFAGLADGVWYLHVRAVDNTGTGGPTSHCAVRIDTTAPTASDDVAGGWQTTAQTVTIGTADASSGPASLVCTLDGHDQALPAGGGSFTVAADGTHTITYHVVDGAGNQSAPVTRTLRIDATAPVTSVTTDPAGWTSGSVQVSLSAADSGGSGLAGTYYRIGGGARQTYGAPFSVTGTAPVSYWSTDAAGNVETAHTLTPKIDTTAPVASDDVASGWQTTAQTVTIAASDADSGVAALLCTLDGHDQGLPIAGGSFAVTADGRHVVSYQATDAAGNASAPVTRSLWIDTTAPTTTASGLQADDASGWCDVAPTVTLTAGDETSGMSGGHAATLYTIDNGATQSYDGAFQVTTPGSHLVTWWSTDAAGNVEHEQQGYVNLDTTAPVTSAAVDPAGWTDGQAQITLSANDDGGSGPAATFYKIGAGGGTQTYNAPFKVADTTPVSYWSTDAAGNVETARTLTPQIDTARPTVTSSADTDDAWHNGDVTVSLSAADTGGSGLAATQYKTHESDTWLDAAGAAFTVTAAGNDGVHAYDYRALDQAGNVSATGACTVRIDTSKPATTAAGLQDAADQGWLQHSATVSLTADDGPSGVAAISYAIDGGAARDYDGPFTVPDSDGPHAVTYWATDAAGNREDTHTGYVNIDATAPSVSSSADGDTSWHSAAVPVTVTAADDGSGVVATQFKLRGDDTWTDTDAGVFTVPATADGSFVYDYRAVDRAGNEATGSCTVRIDTTAPTTTASGLQADDASGWCDAAPTVTLTAGDETSGMSGGHAATLYTIDNGATQSYDGAFQVTTPGSHLVTWWSTDAAGNVEQAQHGYVNLDTVRPTVTSSADTDDAWHNGDVTVSLSAADTGGSGLAATQYKTHESDTWLDATGDAFTVTAAGNDGVHAYDYRALDQAGNVSATGACTVRIDTTAPVASASGLQADDQTGWQTAAQSVSLSATDAGSDGSRLRYSVDGGDTTDYSAAFEVSGDGSHTVTYWATDAAGNEETPRQTGYVNIDTTAPVTSSADLAGDGTSAWQPGPVQVSLQASDAHGAVAATFYDLDDQGMQPYDGPFTVTAQGSHTVKFYSVDALGNAEDPQDGFVNIDSLGPTTTADGLQDSATSGWTTQSQAVTLRAGDAGVGMSPDGTGICYTLDGHGPNDYTGPFQVSGDGSHTVTYWAVDAAGNVGDTGHGCVNIDTTPPATTTDDLVAGSDTGWVHDAQQVTLTATDAGCGDTTTWYTLDGGDPVQYGGPFTVAGVQSHEITYWSVDCLGNREDTQTGYVNIAPDQALITLASGLADTDQTGWRNSPATIALSTSGGGGTIVTQYSLDHGPWQTYAEPFTVSGEGSHQVDYRSKDNVGDDVLQSTGYVNIDTTPPAVTAAAPTTPQRTDVVVVLTPSDAQSRVNATFYRVDNGVWTPGTSAKVAALATHKNDGLHTVSYYAIDNAGNGGSALARQVTVRIDTTRPAFTLRSAKRVTVRRGHALSLRLRARDAGGTCTLVVTLSRKVGKRVVKYTSTLSTRHVSSWQTAKLRLTRPRGTNSAVLRLRDPAGNLSAAKTIRVTIK